MTDGPDIAVPTALAPCLPPWLQVCQSHTAVHRRPRPVAAHLAILEEHAEIVMELNKAKHRLMQDLRAAHKRARHGLPEQQAKEAFRRVFRGEQVRFSPGKGGVAVPFGSYAEPHAQQAPVDRQHSLAASAGRVGGVTRASSAPTPGPGAAATANDARVAGTPLPSVV